MILAGNAVIMGYLAATQNLDTSPISQYRDLQAALLVGPSILCGAHTATKAIRHGYLTLWNEREPRTTLAAIVETGANAVVGMVTGTAVGGLVAALGYGIGWWQELAFR